MNFFRAALLAIVLASAGVGSATVLHGSGSRIYAPTCPYGSTHADGCTTAAYTGSFQNTAYFSGATARPPWNVAGVDYAVGVPTSVTPIAVTAGNIPACTYWQSTGFPLLHVGTSSCTISGYDFSTTSAYCATNGGCGIKIDAGVANTTITKNNFGYASGVFVIAVQMDGAAGSGNTFSWNTVNGGGQNGYASFGTLLSTSNITIEYNYIYNSVCEFVSAGGSMMVKYNYFANGGQSVGCHLNYIQWGDGTNSSPVWDFNTVYQGQGMVNGEVIQMYTQGGTLGSITSGDVSYNSIRTSATLIPSSSGGASPSVSYIFHNGSNTQYPNTSTGTTTNNYVDATSAYGDFYGSLTGWTCSGNIDMMTGLSSNGC